MEGALRFSLIYFERSKERVKEKSFFIMDNLAKVHFPSD